MKMKLKTAGCFLCLMMLFASCVKEQFYTLGKADNKNAQIYILNFSTEEVEVTFGENKSTVLQTERNYSDYEEFLTSFGLEDMISSKVIYADHNSSPFKLTEKEFIASVSETSVDDILTVVQNEKTLLNTKIDSVFKTEFETVVSPIPSGWGNPEKEWEEGKLLFAYDEKSSVQILVDWERIEKDVLSSPWYVIILPPDN